MAFCMPETNRIIGNYFNNNDSPKKLFHSQTFHKRSVTKYENMKKTMKKLRQVM